MEWNYKIELTKPVFEKLDTDKAYSVPADLKEFVEEHNAASPEKCRFVAAGVERVFGAVLSFNEGETESDSVETALEAVKQRDLIPFAIDPAGNYICYNTTSNNIVFWDHEKNETIDIGKSLSVFIESLY